MDPHTIIGGVIMDTCFGCGNQAIIRTDDRRCQNCRDFEEETGTIRVHHIPLSEEMKKRLAIKAKTLLPKRNPVGEVVKTKTVHYVNVEVDGYDAQFWRESYQMLADALEEHLSQFIFDDDCSEEGIYVETIERLGRMLRNVEWDEDDGFVGEVRLNDFYGPILD